MDGMDELGRGNRAARDRAARLSAATLRISESLDVEEVLAEIVQSARALTGARHGVITTIGAGGALEDFLTSGLDPEERRRMVEWPDGPRLFGTLSDLQAPLRVADLPGYLESLGLSTNPWRSSTLQATPMRHRGERVGHFFLSDKRDGAAFTGEDEEVLVLFAAQAAVAISNARAHRRERQARADLEALVDTSPVGVAVFKARTGELAWFNREGLRIVGGLRSPGGSVQELLEVLTVHHPDGKETSLADRPLTDVLRNAEPIRAEEIVLSVPGGRSVRTLMNATPIRGRSGAVESVVVTMQDLGPLEELERSRAAFLSLVGHELRAPLTSIKGSTTTVMTASPELHPAEQREFIRIIDEQADHMRGLVSDLLDAGRIDTGTLAIAPEPTELAALVERARNTFLSGGAPHPVLVDLPARLPPVMADRHRVVQVLNNLFANAARHSPESSPITVSAARDGAHVAVSVADRGRGVALERLPHLFRKHAPPERDGPPAGNGLGLAICKGLVEAHGGRIRAESAGPGRGARFTFTLPVAGLGPAGSGGDASGTAPEERERTRILVVDDDPLTLRFVRDALIEAGYAPLATGEPAELERLIRTERPALVLLDLMLPDTDGIQLMDQIPEARRPARHLHLRLPRGRDHRGRARTRGRRLHRQALLAHRARRQDPGDARARGRARDIRARRTPHPLRPARGHPRRPARRTHRHRVRTPARALRRRRTRRHHRRAPATRLGPAPRRRLRARAHLRQDAPPETRRQRRPTRLHLQPARRRVPHAHGGRGVNAPAGPMARVERRRSPIPAILIPHPRYCRTLESDTGQRRETQIVQSRFNLDNFSP